MPAKTLLAVTLAFAAAPPALAQESLPTFRASVRTDANFPNPEDAARKGGAFVAPEAVLRVTPGMTKSQVYTLERRMAGEIADTFKSGGFQRVTVVGMADTSGNPRYNHSLAQRRAAVVADLLRGTFAERGLPTGVFQVGATQDLTVPTPAGVREPANRRVNVMLGM